MASALQPTSAVKRPLQVDEDGSSTRAPVKRGVEADEGSLESRVGSQKRAREEAMSAAAGSVSEAEHPQSVFNSKVLGNFQQDGESITTIREIVKTIYDANNIVTLIGQFQSLRSRGEEVNKVHPLCFLWCLLSDSNSKRFLQEMLSVAESSGFFQMVVNLSGILKWQGFLGTSKYHDKGITKELAKVYGDLECDDFLEDFKYFCSVLELDFCQFESLIREKNWLGFVEKLLEKDGLLVQP